MKKRENPESLRACQPVADSEHPPSTPSCERQARRTIEASNNAAVIGGMRAKNNGRYNGNGREWATPPEVFDPLNAEFGFTLDACATADNSKLSRFYSEAVNGLEQSWSSERVWMNPPYGREIYAWTRKAREESRRWGALVVGLLPASTDLAWWHEDVVGHAAEVRSIRGRVRFLTGGPYRASGFFASCVVIWQPEGYGRHRLLHKSYLLGVDGGAVDDAKD